MQSIEDELTTLQTRLHGGNPSSGQDRLITPLAQKVQELSQNPLWQEMQRTVIDVQQIKEKFNPVMKDIEARLRKLETSLEDQSAEEKLQIMKEKFHPVMQPVCSNFKLHDSNRKAKNRSNCC